MSGPSSRARRHYESAKEQEIRSLIKAISISHCGKVSGELMNKTKGPGKAAPSRGFSQIKKINPAWTDYLRKRTEESGFLTSQLRAIHRSILLSDPSFLGTGGEIASTWLWPLVDFFC